MLLDKIRGFMKGESRDELGFDLGKITFQLHGQRVCRPFWEFAHLTGPGQVDKTKKMAVAGHVLIPAKAKPMPARRGQFEKADSWFLNLG